MIGDKIIIKPSYFQLSRELLQNLEKLIPIEPQTKWTIGIGGESGSGKSVTAQCLALELEKAGIASLVLHQDDYFKLPPRSNHQNRLKFPDQIGPVEVRMHLLQKHIQDFLGGTEKIEGPEVNYHQNSIGEKVLHLGKARVLIVEGTFAMNLQNLQWKVFMCRNYMQTVEKRLKRNRESFDPFIESVLEKEHQLIHPTQQAAHVWVNTDYKVVINTKFK